MTLAIVTATLDLERAALCIGSWMAQVEPRPRLYIVEQGVENRDWEVWGLEEETLRGRHKRYRSREILGVVPAFAIGVAEALHDGADVIACFHDDLEILQDHGLWARRVLGVFKDPRVGLVGFGGATGLGSADIYQTPYNPMQLARQRFMSNMRDAEAHGERVTEPRRVACLDGFSQIGRRDFWLGIPYGDRTRFPVIEGEGQYPNLFSQMHRWGVIHHFYDGMLGCFAKRLGWEVWMIPVACHHAGGMTAVADDRYHQWANEYAHTTDRLPGILHEGTGDQILWQRSHQIGYNEFRDVLPIYV